MNKIKIWDIGTRLFHWLLVVAFGLSAYSAFQDKYGDFATIHTWSGFTVLVLVIWRIVWGFVGSEMSLFKTFLTSPRAAIAYIKSAKPYEHKGHNPLGGYSVIAMLLLLLVQAVLGLFATDDMFFDGPLTGLAGSDAALITEIHEITGYSLFVLVGLHIAAVAFYAVAKRVNLVLPMITGNAPSDGVSEKPRMRSPLLAAVLLMLIGAVCYQVIWGV
ncbi:cytochrome b/b6 domain-containing protein [Kordiimonas pumila]|uniref:Cytochrome b/b6 domain-containing protein n=1 Tax=Kordiimonas pumila TaxID=2161677 RepID=A0ABV7D4U1_9PROT|nr:cytochrome b/b6 domain-containing protein [Kordiimonas pumila]